MVCFYMILFLLFGLKFMKRCDCVYEYWLGWFGGSFVERFKLGVLWYKECILYLWFRVNYFIIDLYFVFVFIFFVCFYSYVYVEFVFFSKYVSYECELKVC